MSVLLDNIYCCYKTTETVYIRKRKLLCAGQQGFLFLKRLLQNAIKSMPKGLS